MTMGRMTRTLPSRRDEAWRYSDLAVLAQVWPDAAGAARTLVIAAGETRAWSEWLDGRGWRNDTVDIALGDGARLDMQLVQLRDPDTVTTQLYRIALGRGAVCQLDILNAGSRFGRIAVEVTLAESAHFGLGGVILARGEQTVEIVTTVNHLGPGATSRQTVRAVADDLATASYLGKVAVARAAQQTDAAQSVKALLLARTATVNAKPELEIFADDVKCAHGASVGELDANALFYLASRGVAPAESRALLTQAFIAAAFDDVADPAARAALVADAGAWFTGTTA